MPEVAAKMSVPQNVHVVNMSVDEVERRAKISLNRRFYWVSVYAAVLTGTVVGAIWQGAAWVSAPIVMHELARAEQVKTLQEHQPQ